MSETQVKELLSIGNKADLDKKMKESPAELKKVLEGVQDHMNTINNDDTITPAERNKARELLVKLRQLDLDEKQSIETVATATKANLADLIQDVELFSAYEAENVTDGTANLDTDGKKGVLTKFDAAAKELGISRSKAMIMAQRGWDISQDNTAALGGRYDLAIGPKVIGASEDPKKYIDIYKKWLTDANSQGSGGDDTTDTQASESPENTEKPDWLSKIDLGTIGSGETWQTVLKRAGAIDDNNQPVAYLKSLLSLDGKFWGNYKLTVSVLANLDKTQDTYTDWDNLYDSDGMSKSTESEENDIVVLDKNGKAVVLADNPGKMSTFQVDGTGYFDNYRFDSVATFIKFIDQGGKVEDTKDGQEIALDKFGDRLEGGKDGPVAKYMKEKEYINADGDIDNQFNSLMSLPDEAWGNTAKPPAEYNGYKLTLGDIQRFEDSSTYELEEYNPAGNAGTGFGLDLLQARFAWQGGKIVMSDLMDNPVLARSDFYQTSFSNVSDLMKYAKKLEDTTPDNFDLKKQNTGLDKKKAGERYTELDKQMKEFADRFPLSKFGHTVAEDGNSIIISRAGGKQKTIYRNGDKFEIRLGDKKHTFELGQAAAMANLIVFAAKYIDSDGNRVAGSDRPFAKDDKNGIVFDRANEFSNPYSWLGNNGDFLQPNDSWANYYEKQIGTQKMIDVLNDWYETTRPSKKSEA